MSDDALEQILEFSAGPAAALASHGSILKEVLECTICNSLMLDPYTLQCGHAFCGRCLQLWIRERQYQSTCPHCRSNILAEPVLSLGLRQIAVAVAQSWNQAGRTPAIPDDKLALEPTPLFFPNGPASYPVYDDDDDVYRCPDCSHEVDGDQCPNCGRRFRAVVSDRDYTSEDSLSDTISDGDDLRSFIDDDEAESDEVGPRVPPNSRPNFLRMLVDASGRGQSSARYDDDSMDEFVAESESGSDTGSSSPRSGDEAGDAVDLDASSDAGSAADSDDSMLEETRKRTQQQHARRQHTVVDDSDSDVEIVSVQHRPTMVDDD